jgi:hypothetical protein
MGEGWEGVTPQDFSDPVPMVLEEAGSRCFLWRRPLVLAAVNSDNQARVVADKIANVTPQRHLPAESVPVDLIQSRDSPEAFLGVSHISS